MNEEEIEQREFLGAIATALDLTDDTEQLSAVIQGLGEDGMRVMYQYYTQLKNAGETDFTPLREVYTQLMENNQNLYAKLGAKLNYINSLRGKCPEGYTIESYKAGGCVKCKRKYYLEDGNVITQFNKDKKVRLAQNGKKVNSSKNQVALKKEVIDRFDPITESYISTRKWSDGTTSSRYGTEGSVAYKGRRGEVGITNVPNRRQNEIADSLDRVDWRPRQKTNKVIKNKK